jgi:hypothetical protein
MYLKVDYTATKWEYAHTKGNSSTVCFLFDLITFGLHKDSQQTQDAICIKVGQKVKQ